MIEIVVYLDDKVYYEQPPLISGMTFRPVLEPGQHQILQFSNIEEIIVKKELLQHVSTVTIHAEINLSKSRNSGRYCYRSANGSLEKTILSDGSENCKIQLKADNVDDVVALFQQIRSASIAPFESWEEDHPWPDYNEMVISINNSDRRIEEAEARAERAETLLAPIQAELVQCQEERDNYSGQVQTCVKALMKIKEKQEKKLLPDKDIIKVIKDVFV